MQTETPKRDALMALNVEAMTDGEVYQNRQTIADRITLARFEADEFRDHRETRFAGYVCREYVEIIADRLGAVTRP